MAKLMYDKNSGNMVYVGANGQDLYAGANPGQMQVPGIPRPTSVIPQGGRVNVTPLKPTLHRRVIQPTESNQLGTRDYLNRGDNEMSGASGALVANTADNWDTIFEYTVPNQHTLHFKPQNWQARDANCPSFMLMLFHENTAATGVWGEYMIRVENANDTATKAILAKGDLAEHIIGTTMQSSLNDVQTKVYYTEDFDATEGDKIVVRVNLDRAINTATSRIMLGHYAYVP